MKRIHLVLAPVLALAPLAALAAAGLGCATGGDAEPESGAPPRCRTVLETRLARGGVGTEAVSVQRCEPEAPAGGGADLTKQPLDPTSVQGNPR